MHQNLFFIVSTIISVVLFSSMLYNRDISIDSLRQNDTPKMIVKGYSDYLDEVVIDEKTGDQLPMYTYQQMLLSFANQGKVMPCRYLEYDGKYITKHTAKTVSLRTIAKQLDINTNSTSLKDSRFVLLNEGEDMVWYQVDLNTHKSEGHGDRAFGRNLIYLRENPDWTGEKDTTHSKYIFDNDATIRVR